jgi:hypothetical protein
MRLLTGSLKPGGANRIASDKNELAIPLRVNRVVDWANAPGF